MSSTLLIKSADLYYGAAQALYGVTIECKPGRITAVLGRNGVGKSSTLRAVTGKRPLEVSAATACIPVHVPDPASVGADRLAGPRRAPSARQGRGRHPGQPLGHF